MFFFDSFFGGGGVDKSIPPPKPPSQEDSKKSPEVESGLEVLPRGGFREAIFPEEFFGRPRELPEKFKKIDCSVSGFGDLSGYSDYGGEGSKYGNENQDAMGAVLSSNGKKLLMGVFDGVGGEKGGRRAAAACVEGLSSVRVLSRIKLPELMQVLNEGVRDVSADGKNGKAAGVCALITEGGLVELVGIGDSKAMTVRGNESLPGGKTKMQNLAGYIHGENTPGYYLANNKNIITNSLGGGEVLESVESVIFQGEEGDVIILASDALWDVMSEYEVQQIVINNRSGGASKIRQGIFDEVYRRNSSMEPFQINCGDGKKVNVGPFNGSGDNITIQVLELRGLNPSQNKNRKMEKTENNESNPVIDRVSMLCSSGDLMWLKTIRTNPNRSFPVRRSSGEWVSGKIKELDVKEMTAKVVFGDGLCYEEVPLEVILGWLRESGNDTKEKDLMPLATEKFLTDMHQQNLEAIRSSGVVAFFKTKQNEQKKFVFECLIRKVFRNGRIVW